MKKIFISLVVLLVIVVFGISLIPKDSEAVLPGCLPSPYNSGNTCLTPSADSLKLGGLFDSNIATCSSINKKCETKNQSTFINPPVKFAQCSITWTDSKSYEKRESNFTFNIFQECLEFNLLVKNINENSFNLSLESGTLAEKMSRVCHVDDYLTPKKSNTRDGMTVITTGYSEEYLKCLKGGINKLKNEQKRIEEIKKESGEESESNKLEKVINDLSKEIKELKNATVNTYEGCFVGANFSPLTGKSCTGYKPVQSQYDGCDLRNYGFSRTTGKSCVGNQNTSIN
jgi:hypothetical protein